MKALKFWAFIKDRALECLTSSQENAAAVLTTMKEVFKHVLGPRKEALAWRSRSVPCWSGMSWKSGTHGRSIVEPTFNQFLFKPARTLRVVGAFNSIMDSQEQFLIHPRFPSATV